MCAINLNPSNKEHVSTSACAITCEYQSAAMTVGCTLNKSNETIWGITRHDLLKMPGDHIRWPSHYHHYNLQPMQPQMMKSELAMLTISRIKVMGKSLQLWLGTELVPCRKTEIPYGHKVVFTAPHSSTLLWILAANSCSQSWRIKLWVMDGEDFSFSALHKHEWHWQCKKSLQ